MIISMNYLPSPIVMTITNVAPILMFVLDYFINGVQLVRQQVIGVGVCCMGLTVIINMDLILTYFGQ